MDAVRYLDIPLDFFISRGIFVKKLPEIKGSNLSIIRYGLSQNSTSFWFNADLFYIPHRKRWDHKPLRKAIELLTTCPYRAEYYKENFNVGFFPRLIAEEMYVLYPNSVHISSTSCIQREEDLFHSYIEYCLSMTVRERIHPAHKTRSYKSWRMK
jgi:hypothetical protein